MFIAVDKILDNLEKENKDTIDIFGFVKDMRTRRFNMVQTAVSLCKIKCEFSWCIFTTTRNQNKTCSVCRVKFARRNQTKTCSVWCETGSKNQAIVYCQESSLRCRDQGFQDSLLRSVFAERIKFI